MIGKEARWRNYIINSLIETSLSKDMLSGLEKSYAEVDFVLRKGEKLVALEVKSNAIAKTTGMHLFEKKFRPEKVLMVGDSGIPIREFLSINPVQLFS